ncbi:CsgG/HfaB family protein [Burkholderia perseverans]|uniref:CsgG/HfaB family protein n=1 Tax=Burkholderia perseverans TaxID=2615214 RepID=UPI001FEE1493|nr:CsgG/HfaB family protein [Burkholderia perseverans]
MTSFSRCRAVPVALAAVLALGLGACATEASHRLPVASVPSAQVPFSGKPVAIAVGKFDNRSSYMRGVFSDGIDRLGGQAKTILVTRLQQSRRFDVLERDNLAEIRQEAGFLKQPQAVQGAHFVLTGDVTEFGRKEMGDHQLFGILGRGKQQVAYAKVSLNVIDTVTSRVVLSSQGAGEFSLANREVIGFGGTASYDSTLNGKVLDLAIQEAVDHLVAQVDAGALQVAK